MSSSALDSPPVDTTVQFARLPLAMLRECPLNPRQRFNPLKLAELADSIREKGIKVPLLVRRHPQAADAFEIIASKKRARR